MAKSGITYHVGREDNSVYGETWNGVQLLDRHQFPDGIDPYVEKGNPESGLLWGISDAAVSPNGTAETLTLFMTVLQAFTKKQKSQSRILTCWKNAWDSTPFLSERLWKRLTRITKESL